MSRLALLAVTALSCVSTTGSDLVAFQAAAAGPADAQSPLVFTSGAGYAITLTQARLHIGAVYLNRSMPTAGAQPTSCVLPGIYVGEVTSALDVDLLSPEPQPFPAPGEGVADTAVSGEVWLSGADVNALDDTTPVLQLTGTAEKGGAQFPFEARLTIGKNRAIPVRDPALPGASPLCKQRIVSPIPADVRIARGGSLLLRIDPRAMLVNVDFSTLTRAADDQPYRFTDVTDGQADIALYGGLRAKVGVYTFTWQP